MGYKFLTDEELNGLGFIQTGKLKFPYGYKNPRNPLTGKGLINQVPIGWLYDGDGKWYAPGTLPPKPTIPTTPTTPTTPVVTPRVGAPKKVGQPTTGMPSSIKQTGGTIYPKGYRNQGEVPEVPIGWVSDGKGNWYLYKGAGIPGAGIPGAEIPGAEIPRAEMIPGIPDIVFILGGLGIAGAGIIMFLKGRKGKKKRRR